MRPYTSTAREMATATLATRAFARPRVLGTPPRARFVRHSVPAGRSVVPKPSPVKTRATEGDDTPDPEKKEAAPEEQKQYRGVDISGGKYGMGESIDKGLDATTNPDSFLFGFVFLCSFAILAFLFGPRPPSDYYG